MAATVRKLERFGARRHTGIVTALAAIAAIGALAGTASAQEPAAAEQARPLIDIAVDEARVVRLSRAPRSIIIGNPLIADAVIDEDGIMILIGRQYGSTNLIALDEVGNELASYDLAVRTSGVSGVSLFRGVNRVSLNCAPRCETELDVGDGAEHFDIIRGQIESKTGLSRGQAGDAQ